MRIKRIYLPAVFLLMLCLALFTGCMQEKSPYDINDAENYTVSVRYDANGGYFTTNTQVITDSYNLAELPGSGNTAEIPLLSPDDPARDNDAFVATKSGCFLAGWYQTRTETVDDSGEKVYVYSDKWDFKTDRLTVSKDQQYTSSEPVITLYAAWVPMFEIRFYDLKTGEACGELLFNPETGKSFDLPFWNEETGAIEMNRFPERSGYTFAGVYYDQEGTKPVTGESFEHPGLVDETNGMAKNGLLNLYVDWTEGDWYHIYNVEQFLDHASVSGHYVLHADLDFADEIWPSSLMYGNFTGSIEGNGHTMKNITITQTNNSKTGAGLFGHLTEEASLQDLTFENVTFTVKNGTRVAGTAYGLLAGSLSDAAAVENLTIRNGQLLIDSGCYFGVEDYSIGLLCGMGNAERVDYSDIRCSVVGDDPGRIRLQVSGNTITLEFVN